MAVLLIITGVVVVLGAIAFIMNGRRQAAPVAPHVFNDFEEGLAGEPPSHSPIEPSRIAVSSVVDETHPRWTKQFEPRSGGLSDEARLRLIKDLGLLRAPWCVPLLTQAYEEEADSVHKVAAKVALARCREENNV
jgi:hypothetical protein